MMRKTCAFVTTGVFAGLLAAAGSLWVGPAAHAQPPTLAGSWQVTINQGPGRPVLEALHTYTADGSFLGTNAIPITTQPQMTGSGTEAHGAWRQVGGGKVAIRAVGVQIDPRGRFGGLFKLHATATVAPGGTTFHGTETFTIGAPNGKVIVAGRATFTGTRIAP